ncbi:MAG TPA: hypothetical protein VMS22_04065 [Candidatus Eisenbacteria bacterium]|nr:hypothetical protein [Candidatus Eisenbacteria bacterium]
MVAHPNLDRINYTNIGLMLGSAALACTLPFEMFLLAYAVLGPLHYLTQISWLHDRGFYTTGRHDWIPLAALGVVAFVAAYTTWLPWDGAPFAALGSGVAAAYVRNPIAKASALVTAVALAVPVLSWPPAGILFLFLLTTVVHVYVFTGVFILAGSMKAHSRSGYASFAVYVVCGAALLLVQPAAAGYDPSPYTRAGVEPFGGLIDAMALLVPGRGEWPAVVAIGRFLAFAYTYHYLNWFSKTGIIRWHEMSRARMAVIGVVYAASLAVYAADYRIGLMALFFLSIAHVFLEFPLDTRTIVDVATGMRRRAVAS